MGTSPKLNGAASTAPHSRVLDAFRCAREHAPDASPKGVAESARGSTDPWVLRSKLSVCRSRRDVSFPFKGGDLESSLRRDSAAELPSSP